MQQRGSKYFARRPAPTYTGTPTLWMGSVGKKSFFSVHGNVTYQIKEKYFGRPLPPPHPRDGVSRSKHFFKYMDMLHIKLKKITNAATWWQIFCVQTPIPLTLRMGSVGKNSPLSEHGYGVYQIKENHECSNIVPNILLADGPTQGWGQ